MKNFSVLIAHYNNFDYFKDCYDSLLTQTFKDFEVIVVDDCSTDDSFEKLSLLTKDDARVKLFRNEENKGVGYTKRKCVEMASGEICGFVDPDDALTENAIMSSLACYKTNPSIIATYSLIETVDETMQSKGVFKLTRKIPNSQKDFFNINFEVAHFFTFKKSVYDSTIGINPELSSAVDQDMYLKLYEKGDFLLINEVFYLYRLHNKGVSQDSNKKTKLNENWHNVILETCKRRDIKKLYGKNVDSIPNLPKFIYEKENSFLKKLLRKLN